MIETDSLGCLSILFTDVEGSTHGWESAYEHMAASLAVHDALIRHVTTHYEGVIFSVAGDSFGIIFSQPMTCLQAGKDILAQLAITEWPNNFAIRVRQSMHTGVVIQRDGGAYGPEIVRAAIVCELGHAGQILLSAEMQERLAEHQDTHFLGTFRVRKISEPQRVYQVGQQEFAELRSSFQRINTLPASSKTLLGRDIESRQLQQLLDEHKLVTITGPGGGGKTSLAIDAAQKQYEKIRHGVHFVDLSTVVNDDDIPTAVAKALELTLLPEQNPADQLLHYLKPRQSLIVFDNCEHLLDPGADLIETLINHCPDLTVLATSRESLELEDELVFRLPTLSTGVQASATDLFLQCSKMRSGAALDTLANRNIINDICQQIDGLPLAIELAAAQTRSMSLVQIRYRLRQHASALSAKRRGRERQQLATVIAWSVELLNDQERRVFGQLAVFPGSFALEDASAILQPVRSVPIDELIDALVAKSLVETEAGHNGQLRLRMLNTIRDVAYRELERSGAASNLADQHCQHFLALAERVAHPFVPHPELRRQQHAEYLNLCHAAEWAIENGEPGYAARIASSCVICIDAIGDFKRAIDWCRGVCDNTDVTAFNARITEAFLRGSEGSLEHESALADEAIALYQQLSDEDRDTCDMLPVALCLSALYKMTTDPQAAQARLHEAMQAAQKTTVANLNLVFTSMHFSWLEALYGRSEAVLKRTRHFNGAMNTLTRVLAHLQQGNIELARSEIAANENANTDAWQHFHDISIAQTSLAAGEVNTAIEVLIESAGNDSGLRRWQDADYLINFACVHHQLNNDARAEQILETCSSRHALMQCVALKLKQRISQWPLQYDSPQSLDWLQQIYSQAIPDKKLARQAELLSEELSHWRGYLTKSSLKAVN